MVYYEIKKIFGTWGSKIALMLLAAVVVISCWSAVTGYGTGWINEQGREETGPAAIAKLKAAKKEWAGPLDTERITAAMLENQRINATLEAQSRDYDQNDIAFGWKQGISDIREVVNGFFSEDFSSYSYYLADEITLDRLPELYDNRVKLLSDWLYAKDSNQDNLYTEAEKQWLLKQYRALEEPMEYDYFLGWNRVTETSPTIIMLTAMILGYLVAGIFANEFKWKSDSIYFSTALGRTVNTRAKILAGILLVSGIYWACILVYTLYTLIYLGLMAGIVPFSCPGGNAFTILHFWSSIC